MKMTGQNLNEVTQNEFLNRYIKQNDKLVEFMTKINSNLDQLNDNNVLHRKSLEEGTVSTKEAVASFKSAVEQQNKNFTFWKKIIFLMTVAIIILAGVKADEISKLLGII